jgi:phage regulator Rha-like protein
VRGHRIMLDSDLAEIYGVTTKRLLEQMRRNADRFPKDFAFQLDREELTDLRSQIATLKPGRGQHRKYLPYVFTEHGALMLASVLNSPRAVEMSIYVVRGFVRLRSAVMENKELAESLRELERRVTGHDEDLQTLVAAVRELMEPPPAPERPRIGFDAR